MLSPWAPVGAGHLEIRTARYSTPRMADDDKAALETDHVDAEHDGGGRQHAQGVVTEGAVFGVGIEDQRSQQQ